MKKKPKLPQVPDERRDTLRHEIISALEGRTLSAREISSETGITERDVYEHLEHVQRTLNKKEQRLSVLPAECNRCGFVFSKRERLKKPGRCPRCRSESIHEPLFRIIVNPF